MFLSPFLYWIQEQVNWNWPSCQNVTPFLSDELDMVQQLPPALMCSLRPPLAVIKPCTTTDCLSIHTLKSLPRSLQAFTTAAGWESARRTAACWKLYTWESVYRVTLYNCRYQRGDETELWRDKHIITSEEFTYLWKHKQHISFIVLWPKWHKIQLQAFSHREREACLYGWMDLFIWMLCLNHTITKAIL